MNVTWTPKQREEGAPASLIPTWTDLVLSYLPTWLHGHRGDLLHYERMAQRYYRQELQQYELVLRDRGELVGEALVNSIFPEGPSSRSRTAGVSYSSVMADSLAEGDLPDPLKHLVWSVELLIAPVLNPFVEGLKAPVMKRVDQKEWQVQQAILLAALGSGLAGLALGFTMGKFSSKSRDK